jgi:hypothetical protein
MNMSIDLNELKKLSMRQIAERKSLIEALTATPAAEHPSSEWHQTLVEMSAIGAAVTREITAREPNLGWDAPSPACNPAHPLVQHFHTSPVA